MTAPLPPLPADLDDDGSTGAAVDPSVNEQASRLGKAVEYLVASSCIIASGGRLNVLTGLIDDEGVDLVFSRYGTTATMSVQVKARRSDRTPLVNGMFQSNVRAQTFRPRADLYILFVVVEPDGSYEMVWLIPSLQYAAMLTPNARGRLVFQASMSPTTQDRWRPFRLSRSDLAAAVLAVLERAP